MYEVDSFIKICQDFLINFQSSKTAFYRPLVIIILSLSLRLRKKLHTFSVVLGNGNIIFNATGEIHNVIH